MPAMIFMSVVLPAPLPPMMPIRAAMVMVTFPPDYRSGDLPYRAIEGRTRQPVEQECHRHDGQPRSQAHAELHAGKAARDLGPQAAGTDRRYMTVCGAVMPYCISRPPITA
mgnify:CR=1 FL=1